jgi:hypothetical protein
LLKTFSVLPWHQTGDSPFNNQGLPPRKSLKISAVNDRGGRVGLSVNDHVNGLTGISHSVLPDA